ncbi:unnamed protein product [Tilletia controversa]|nr:unnamed protein product [Tilletia controversa]
MKVGLMLSHVSAGFSVKTQYYDRRTTFRSLLLIDNAIILHNGVLVHYNAFTVGESGLNTVQQALDTTQHGKPLQQLFTFDHLSLDLPPSTTSVFDSFQKTISEWQHWALVYDSWLGNFLSNHDQLVVASQSLQHALLALFSCSLARTLFVYQGEELGMLNVPADWTISEYDDIVSKRYHKDVMAEKQEESAQKGVPVPADFEKQVMMSIMRKARDNARTPIAWDDTPSAGFFSDPSAKFWMKFNPDNITCNVRVQRTDPTSVFHFWKRSIQLRKAHDVLVYGSYRVLDIPVPAPEEGQTGSPIFNFVRELDGVTAVFVGNFARARLEGVDLGRYVTDAAGEARYLSSKLVACNYEVDKEERSLQVLEPFEARLYILS